MNLRTRKRVISSTSKRRGVILLFGMNLVLPLVPVFTSAFCSKKFPGQMDKLEGKNVLLCVKIGCTFYSVVRLNEFEQVGLNMIRNRTESVNVLRTETLKLYYQS